MRFDAEAVRREFPILARQVDGTPLHYLDNAASAQMSQAVIDAVTDHEMNHRANVLRGVHRLAEEATQAFEDARFTVAGYINAQRVEEVIFTSGTTAAINLVAHSFGNQFTAGDEIVVSCLEHHSNIVPWQLLRERRGITIKVLPPTADGRLDLTRLDELVGNRCRLIAVTHASNVTGAVTEVAQVVEAARRVGAKVLLDGAQRAPHGPLDIQALGVDFYAFSGHKAFGPNGIGVLWVRWPILETLPPFLGGGEMIRQVTFERTTYADPPHRFEAGTPPIAQAVGMAAALNWIAKLDAEGVQAHLNALTGKLLDGLSALDRKRGLIRLFGPSGLQERLPVVSFTIDGAHPHDICQILDRHGCALRGGHHCAQPLMNHFEISGTTRASLAPYNNEEDIDAMLSGLDDAMTRLL
ncbi:MAG: SufS family cysteine desulfurase [Proteobacteria bacterium]|nr:SufS family cysteine desulfurase [Pseudomonadota bacterium]